MEKNFVIFFSPGTFLAEQDQREIDTWDVEKAKELAKTIHQRYGARPYGFRFITRGRSDDELDSKVVEESGMYYIGGEVMTIEDVKAQNDPKNEILISNMEGNGYDKVVTSNSGNWNWTQPFRNGDTLLENFYEKIGAYKC